MARTIGIDLGHSNSCVAAFDDMRPVVIRNAEGDRTTPSCVAFTAEGEVLVGTAAKRRLATDPSSGVAGLKRLIGSGEEGDGGRSPTAIAAHILAKLKADAEAALGEGVDTAVIAVPAHFNHNRRRATLEAARIAGLDVRRVISETTGAALAYGLNRGENETLLVVDLGGGSLDAAVIAVRDDLYEVKASAGDGRLGGDDFDAAIVGWLTDRIAHEHGIDATGDAVAGERLREAAERAKVELSSADVAQVVVPFLSAHGSAPAHVDLQLSRPELEALTRPLVDRIAAPVEQVLDDAWGKHPQAVDEVLLVGGMTRMPAVHEMVKTLTGRNPQRSVDADEAVALGAATEGAILDYTIGGALVFDVLTGTVGIETETGGMARVIERNTPIPTRRIEKLAPSGDGAVHVLQGESPRAADNASIGRYELPRAAFVRLDVDGDGVVHVSSEP
jgi:molecular chaperone DnaK